MLVHAIALAGAAVFWTSAWYAAPDCAAGNSRKAGDQIVDWYEVHVKPFRVPSGSANPGKAQVEALVGEMASFHGPAVLDPLYFEPLVRQISSHYVRSSSFRGLDSSVAEEVSRAGTETRYDFSLLCIAPKTVRSADDAFSITLFGVSLADCQHVAGLRGLVFTETLVNGGGNGQCRPDLTYYRMLVVPVVAGTNSITFVCHKDTGGCAR